MALLDRTLRRIAVVAATFLATLGVLVALHHGAPAGPSTGGAAAEVDPPAPGSSTDDLIRGYQRVVRTAPRQAAGYAALAGAYLQKVRETGDPTFYARADDALRAGRRIASDDARLLVAAGTLALARHDFAAGLRYGLAARRSNPASNSPYPVIVDAQVELGRYAQAGRTLQTLLDRKPALASYARASYFRELHGDLPAAVEAMRLAVSAGGDRAENVAYVQTLLGNLELDLGRLGGARAAYRLALARFPGYVPAEAGLARVDAGAGRLTSAIRRYRRVVERLPLPEHVVALAESELAAGRGAAARRDLALVGAEERLLRANGVDTDVDLALFEANHGRPARAVALARRAWSKAPSVRSADALGWSLTRAGRPAAGLAWAHRALRLGSRDATFLYHAGMSARAAGRLGRARRYLRASLALNPRFSPLYAPRARRALEALR